MPLNLLYELKKCEVISYAELLRLKNGGCIPLVPHRSTPMMCKNFPIQHFGKEICHHSNGNNLHKVQESAASAVGDKHQAGEG